MLALSIHEDVCKLSMMFYLNLFYIIFVLFPNGINDHTFHLLDIDGGTDWWKRRGVQVHGDDGGGEQG